MPDIEVYFGSASAAVEAHRRSEISSTEWKEVDEVKAKTGKATMLIVCFAALLACSIVCSVVGFAANYFTVKIEYKFSDGSDAHDPYVAVLPTGSDVDLTVKNPILPGYKPVDPQGNEAPQTVLNYQSLDSNQTVTVTYISDLVHYKVRYFMQNVQDDLYTEDLSLTNDYYEKTGYTGSYPEALDSISFPGFTSLFHDPDVIAADGSTVFKLYYDRNYYLVDFHLGDGGYGVEPVYAKHGTTFNIGTPKRAGYTFLGWVRSNAAGDYLDNNGNVITEEQARSSYNSFSSGIVPIGDSYYRAVWQPERAKFSVVYWSENPGDNGYSVIAEREITRIVENNQVVDVKADMTITPETYIKNKAGTKNIKLKDFFGLNLNYADPNNSKNQPSDPEYDPDIRYDSDGNIIDINDISKGVTEEYKGNEKFFELNTASNMPSGSQYITDTSITVSGDGASEINIFFKRRPFTLKFFYARQGLTNGVPNGKISLTNSTKKFSNKQYSGSSYMAAVAEGSWQDDIADSLPTLNTDYAAYISENTIDYGNYRYYYYQVTSKYNAPLKNKWFVDSVKPVHKKGYADIEMCIPGSWAVEYGTNYYFSHKSVNNFTIKGIYEKLGVELMFRDRTSDYTELHYLVSWTNTSKTNNWNYGISRVLRFKYLNYVELTSFEKGNLRSEFGLQQSDPDSAIPSDPILDNGVPIREPTADGQGTPINIGLVRPNSLVNGSNPVYSEIVKFDPDSTGQPKFYGLKTTFDEIDTEASFEVDTTDSGDQYDRSKTEFERTKKVRENQTPTDLTGYQIENYRLNGNNQIVLDYTNTTVDWSEDTPTNRRATIRFFYRRRTYNLSFRNGSDFEKESYTVQYGEYVNYTTAPQHLFPAVYYNEDLKNYFSFNGWYFDPTFSDAEATAGFAMPSDDIILYAKWVPVEYQVKFYNDFGDYTDGVSPPVNTCMVPYNTKILTSEIPMDDENASVRLTPASEHARFAGWYYLDREGKPARFDPENLPVTHDMELYAEWESTETAQYRVRYIEKGTGIEVADTDTGTIFVSKTRTFSAKTGDKYNADHQWVDNQPNWWPLVSSHSILVEPNTAGETYAPNEFTFEYIRKTDPVYYAVQYLDSETNQPLQDPVTRSTYYAAVTETAPYIEDYVADSVTKARVLSASEKSGAEAMEEELRSNVIVFFYTKTDTTALYQVDHYIQTVDDTGYELYNSETLYGTKNEIVSINSIETGTIASGLTSSGFTCDHANTTVSVNGAAATAAGASVTLTGEPTIISVYYDRSSYGYTVKYVDYDQEKLYDSDSTLWNGELYTVTYNGADKQPLGKDVSINAPSLYTYTGGADPVNYTRVSDRQLVFTIRYDDPESPSRNIIKVYYKVDRERQLSYRVVCDRETTDEFAYLTKSLEIVTNYEGVTGSEVIPLTLTDHEYLFLGWFSTPEASESSRLTDDSTFTYKPATLPGADMTYYAVFRQNTVTADIEVRYNDSGDYTDDSTAIEDVDGSITGHTVAFTTPAGYVSGTQTALDKESYFGFDIAKQDENLYPYEFTRWYKVENGVASEVTPASGESGFTEPMTTDCRYIAMFKKRASVDYEIKYRFTTRAHGVQDFIVKDTLSAADFAAALNDSGSCELKDEFILAHAPYESNYGETLSWSETQITADSSENGGITVTVTASQSAKTVYANYRLYPNEAYRTPIATVCGANRDTDEKLAVIDARGLTYNDSDFSYWEIRKSAQGEVIAKCYSAWFSYCMMDSYYISPVYGGEAQSASAGITLTHLDYSRNRWTDENGDIDASGATDLLYTDFEIAFEDGGSQIYGENSGYRAGVVFELCGKMGASAVFDPTRDYGFYSDPDALKAAVKSKATSYTTQNKPGNGAVKTRSIQCSEIDTANMTNKNRIEFAQYYPNAYTPVQNGDKNYTYSVYLMKATAYLVKGDDVTLSNSVYICFKTEAARELMLDP